VNRRDPDQELNHKSDRVGFAFIVRVYWMMLGYIPVFASIAAIIESENGPSTADATYWVGVLSIVLARLYDITRLGGTTAEGEPATLAHWRRYAGSLVVITMVVWIVLRIVSRPL
jgi:hypothetical protein